jgi:effector-binding domain-containing protein
MLIGSFSLTACTSALGALLLTAPPAGLAMPIQDEALPEAARLLDAADAKIAPPEARTALASLRARGTLEAMGMKMSVEELYLGGDRARISFRIPKMAPMTMGVEPRFAWSTDPAMGILTVAGAEAAPMRRLMGFGRRAPWRELYAQAKTIGAETVDGKTCWKIETLGAEGTVEHLFLERESGLPLCLDLALPDFREGSLAMRFFFEDWKPVAGILFPHRKRQVIGTYDLATRFESIEVGPAIEAADVAPPAEVLEHWEKHGARPRSKALAPGECRTEEIEARHALAVRLEIEEQDISKTLAVILPEVMGALGELGATPAGPPYTRYHRREGGRIELEGGIPVRAPLEGKGREKPVTLPGGLVATTWHHGSYHELSRTYGVLQRWMEEQGLRSSGAFFEIYWTDPGLEPDPARWRTQVIWPVEARKKEAQEKKAPGARDEKR